LEPQSLIHWSSFPSDHAALFFALAMGMLPISRRCGALALAHATLLISLPRIYLGIHWFTDILAGAVLGIGLALAGMRLPISRWLQRTTVPLFQRHPSLCYAALFGLTYLIATLFDDARYLGSALLHLLRGR